MLAGIAHAGQLIRDLAWLAGLACGVWVLALSIELGGESLRLLSWHHSPIPFAEEADFLNAVFPDR